MVKEQTKWIVKTKTPEGKLETKIMKFKPHVGQKLTTGAIIIEVA